MPERLDDYIAQDNPVKVIDAFVGRAGLRRAWLWRCPACRHGKAAYYLVAPPKPSTSDATGTESSPAAAWSASGSCWSSDRKALRQALRLTYTLLRATPRRGRRPSAAQATALPMASWHEQVERSATSASGLRCR